MEIINFDRTPSLMSQYMRELRDISIQHDPLRFRTNLDRIGQIMAYEISRTLQYEDIDITTPLGPCTCRQASDRLVLATILRAGLPFHHGFLSFFDRAENAFVSAYRRYKREGRQLRCAHRVSCIPVYRWENSDNRRPDACHRLKHGTRL